MKHLMRYEGYTSTERVDELLDKISKYGVSSLSKSERDFLDSHKVGKEEEMHRKLSIEEVESTFEDDHGYFKFEHTDTEDYGDEVHYIGVMYVPDLKLSNGKTIEGRLCGRIVANINTGQVSPDFDIDDYDIYEFCNGLEYELDSFLDYVVSELDIKKNEN